MHFLQARAGTRHFLHVTSFPTYICEVGVNMHLTNEAAKDHGGKKLPQDYTI